MIQQGIYYCLIGPWNISSNKSKNVKHYNSQITPHKYKKIPACFYHSISVTDKLFRRIVYTWWVAVQTYPTMWLRDTWFIAVFLAGVKFSLFFPHLSLKLVYF